LNLSACKNPFLEEEYKGEYRAMTRVKIIPYNPQLKNKAKYLRKNMTLPEVLLWQHLKGKQMVGFDFDRQRPIDEYIVDFYCKVLMLAVEVGGQIHDYQIEKDKLRQEKIESFGVRFLRFSAKDVLTNMEGVLITIEAWIKEHQ